MLLVPLMTVRSSAPFEEGASSGAIQAVLVILFFAAPLVVLAWLIRTLVQTDSNWANPTRLRFRTRVASGAAARLTA